MDGIEGGLHAQDPPPALGDTGVIHLIRLENPDLHRLADNQAGLIKQRF